MVKQLVITILLIFLIIALTYHFVIGEFDPFLKAQDHYEFAIQNSPDHLQARLGLADLLTHQLKRIDEARQVYEAIFAEFKPHPPVSCYHQYAIFLTQYFPKEKNTALAYLKKSLRIEPTAENYTNAAIVLKKHFPGTQQLALSYFQRSVEIIQSYGLENVDYLNNLGEQYYQMGKYSLAENVFNRAALYSSLNPRTFYNLAKLSSNAGRYVQARELYQSVLRNPGINDHSNNELHADTYNNLGYLYQEIFREYHKASYCYQKALSIKKEHTEVFRNQGYLFIGQNKFHNVEDAAERFERYLKSNQNDADVHYQLANLYHKNIR